MVLNRVQRLRTNDRRDLDKGLSLSPGAMLYARRRPLLDFESPIFKTAIDLRLAGEYLGEETMIWESRKAQWSVNKRWRLRDKQNVTLLNGTRRVVIDSEV